MAADHAGIRAVVGATADAGTAYYELRLESVPAGVTRSRSQGVCDFTQRRAAGYTVTEVPEDVPGVFQITDGGVVYSQLGGPGRPATSGTCWTRAAGARQACCRCSAGSTERWTRG
jgi:hypothetical protein